VGGKRMYRMKLKNSRKRYYTILGSGMLLLCLSGCGNAAEINAEADSTVDMVAEEDMESKSESVLEENVQIQSDDTEAEQEETATENADELKTEDLQSIIDSYDNVLSIENSAAGVVPIFGYHIPELSESIWFYVYSVGTTDWDNKAEGKAISDFYKTGVWEKPERMEAIPYGGNVTDYITEMEKKGELETIYGKAVFYQKLSERVFYSNRDDDNQYYVPGDSESDHGTWDIYEGVLLQVKGNFIDIIYSKGEDGWSTSDYELPYNMENHEYTGTLEEILPQMIQ
jgi:hypothetical protein